MASGEEDVGRERGQFLRLSANCGGIGCGPAGVDPHIAADDPSQQRQRLLERSEARLPDRIVRSRGREHANAPHLVALLRARRERPRCGRATEQRNERAAFHVWMAPAWQEIIWRAAQKSLAVMCPACSRSPEGLLALMESANRGLITRAGSMSQ